MSETPTTNGPNGELVTRDERGRFKPGNPGGPGNPHAAQVGRWRASLAASVSDDDLMEVIAALVGAAKEGQPWAVKELLDRCLGRPRPVTEDSEAPSDVVVRVVYEAEPIPDHGSMNRDSIED